MYDAIKDDAWLHNEFITTVQQRGAAVIKARKLSSAMSAAKAIGDHMRDWWFGTNVSCLLYDFVCCIAGSVPKCGCDKFSVYTNLSSLIIIGVLWLRKNPKTPEFKLRGFCHLKE